MSHHSESLPADMLTDAKRLKLGATGVFPDGKLREEDEGEIRFGVYHDPETGMVIINFGKSVVWLGMTAAQAIDFAQSIMSRAERARDIGKYPEAQCEAIQSQTRPA